MRIYKENLYIALCVFLIIFLTLSLIAWKVFFTQLSELKVEYAENRKELVRAEKRASLKNELEKELRGIEAEAMIVNNALLDKKNILAFIESLENLAAASQNIYEVKIAQELKNAETGELEAINFDISLRGSFDNLMTFLRGVKKMSYLTNEIQTSIDYSNDGKSLQTNLILKVYVK